MAVPETIRTATLGKRRLRLVQRDSHYFGLADGSIRVDGRDAEDVWRRLHREIGTTDPRYFGFKGARARFVRHFPEGFASADYGHHERDYKVAAKTRLDDTVPLERAGVGTDLGEVILGIHRRTNLLSPFEKVRVQDLLRSPAADAYVNAAARFAVTPTKTTLGALDAILRPHDCAKWTIVTYLPFLWRPDVHMFLKPEVTKDYAARVGHSFADAYRPRLDLDVYTSLLDLAEATGAEIADLEPRDRIDIQSFIWVVGKYDDNAGESVGEGADPGD